MLTVVPDGCPGRDGGEDASPSLIDESVSEGAGRMLAGVDAYLAWFAGQRLAMAFPLIRAAQDHGCMVSAPRPGGLVRAGARSGRGVPDERPGPAAA